ncbi:MAG: IS200/IS605 family transposase [Paramuribaculum sp.]|nr:IS200/IS605 family transposase [Paramuribaculum sp.]
MSRVTSLYHIVFATKRREQTITHENREALYRYIWTIISKSNSVLYRIGGVSDHIHILLDLHPTVPLSTMVRDIKSRSSSWMKQSGLFAAFSGWATEYFAASVSYADKNGIIEYIKSQPEHHAKVKLDEELKILANDAGLALTSFDLM